MELVITAWLVHDWAPSKIRKFFVGKSGHMLLPQFRYYRWKHIHNEAFWHLCHVSELKLVLVLHVMETNNLGSTLRATVQILEASWDIIFVLIWNWMCLWADILSLFWYKTMCLWADISSLFDMKLNVFVSWDIIFVLIWNWMCLSLFSFKEWSVTVRRTKFHDFYNQFRP